jgi:hypothetical protein
VARAHLRGE